MTSTFCDGCGAEITAANDLKGGTINEHRMGTEVLSANRRCKLKVELLLSKDGGANDGDFCRYCVLDAFTSLDDRPMKAP